VKHIKARFIERIQRTPSVASFRFMPPEKIDFSPGQFVQVIFDEQNGQNQQLNKYLSLSVSPLKEYLEVTKRISGSEFSQRLNRLRAGDEVLMRAPMGSCVFRDGYKKIGFLIGGIGITPVISIIEYVVKKNLTTNSILFYSNRTEEEIVFKQELDAWQKGHCNVRVFYTVTDCQPKDPACSFGHIDKDLITLNAGDIRERIFFIFGPPKMVEAMNGLCLEAGCSKENIKTENFIGY